MTKFYPDVSTAPRIMRDRPVDRSGDIGQLAAALAKAQGAMSTAKEDSDNPFFRSKYADYASIWNACRTPLSENSLSVVQLPSTGTEVRTIQRWNKDRQKMVDMEVIEVTVTTVLMHESGQWIQSAITLWGENTPQGIGSARSYGMRYGLAPMVGVATGEDDDGEAAMGRGTQQAATTKKRAPEPPAAETILSVTESEAGGTWGIKTNAGEYLTQDQALADRATAALEAGVDIVATATAVTIGKRKVRRLETLEEITV